MIKQLLTFILACDYCKANIKIKDKPADYIPQGWHKEEVKGFMDGCSITIDSIKQAVASNNFKHMCPRCHIIKDILE